MKVLLFLASFFIGSSSTFASSDFDPFSVYGRAIEFDVIRNGDVVGEHITRFEKTETGYRVTSRMTIDIFVLFLPVYGFDYQSKESWSKGQLDTLDVNVKDGADKIQFQMNRANDTYQVALNEQTTEIEGTVFSTNHWHPDVLNQPRVLNTLTGNMNNVVIDKIATGPIDVRGGFINATRYDYSGDLTDTSVWYDADGRWVKLRFKARDGSIIDYQCRTCS